jgi:hypothetical protein
LSSSFSGSAWNGKRLAVVETNGAYLVTEADDAEQWLVRFEEGTGFPAQEWAENMVRIFNARAEGSTVPLLTPGKEPTSYHLGSGNEGGTR